MAAKRLWRFVGLVVCLTGTLCAEDEVDPSAAAVPSFQLEVEIVRGEELSWIRVYLRNRTNQAIRLKTGAAGGPGSLDDGYRVPGYEVEPVSRDPEHRWIVGSCPKVVPVLTFRYAEAGDIQLTPPSLRGPTRRAMRPYFFEVPADGRRLYASFAVASIHVAGEFRGCRMDLPDGSPRLAPCTRLIELTEHRAHAEE